MTTNKLDFNALMAGEDGGMKQTRTKIPGKVTRVRNAVTGEVKDLKSAKNYIDNQGLSVDNALINHQSSIGAGSGD